MPYNDHLSRGATNNINNCFELKIKYILFLWLKHESKYFKKIYIHCMRFIRKVSLLMLLLTQMQIAISIHFKY